jgi:hypothetical protein
VVASSDCQSMEIEKSARCVRAMCSTVQINSNQRILTTAAQTRVTQVQRCCKSRTANLVTPHNTQMLLLHRVKPCTWHVHLGYNRHAQV